MEKESDQTDLQLVRTLQGYRTHFIWDTDTNTNVCIQETKQSLTFVILTFSRNYSHLIGFLFEPKESTFCINIFNIHINFRWTVLVKAEIVATPDTRWMRLDPQWHSRHLNLHTMLPPSPTWTISLNPWKSLDPTLIRSRPTFWIPRLVFRPKGWLCQCTGWGESSRGPNCKAGSASILVLKSSGLMFMLQSDERWWASFKLLELGRIPAWYLQDAFLHRAILQGKSYGDFLSFCRGMLAKILVQHLDNLMLYSGCVWD